MLKHIWSAISLFDNPRDYKPSTSISRADKCALFCGLAGVMLLRVGRKKWKRHQSIAPFEDGLKLSREFVNAPGGFQKEP